MINKRTCAGVCLCVVGVCFFKTKDIIILNNVYLLGISSLGIVLSFTGLAVFTSGLKTRKIEKIKICPDCFKKNNASAPHCIKCKKKMG